MSVILNTPEHWQRIRRSLYTAAGNNRPGANGLNTDDILEVAGSGFRHSTDRVRAVSAAEGHADQLVFEWAWLNTLAWVTRYPQEETPLPESLADALGEVEPDQTVYSLGTGGGKLRPMKRPPRGREYGAIELYKAIKGSRYNSYEALDADGDYLKNVAADRFARLEKMLDAIAHRIVQGMKEYHECEVWAA